MNKNKTNKRSNRSTKATKARKSLKGQWGHIGAPPKPMRWPNRPFVMAALFAFNPTLCELTVRKNVDKAVENGTLVALEPLPQKGGAVGRPKSRFVLKSKFVASKMTLAPAKTAKTVKTVVATVTPAPAPVTPTPAPVVETVTAEAVPATPQAPATSVVEAPVVETIVADITPAAPVTDIPATPAVETAPVS